MLWTLDVRATVLRGGEAAPPVEPLSVQDMPLRFPEGGVFWTLDRGWSPRREEGRALSPRLLSVHDTPLRPGGCGVLWTLDGRGGRMPRRKPHTNTAAA